MQTRDSQSCNHMHMSMEKEVKKGETLVLQTYLMAGAKTFISRC